MNRRTSTFASRRRGTILIVVMLVIAALAGMVLVIGRSARVEAMASANYVAGAKAAAVERGAEQYVIALLSADREGAMLMEENYFAEVPVGDGGSFWIVRPDYGDSDMPMYGLVDEASKINLNSIGDQQLLNFPAVPESLAYSIVDWRDENDDMNGDGAEDAYYRGLPTPYRCKNARFETVDELLLVRGAYPELLYGTGAGFLAANNTGGLGGASLGGLSEEDVLARGLYNYFTVYSLAPAGGGGGGGGAQNRLGRINVNTASREVLLCLPGMTDADASALLSRRSSDGFGATDTAWVSEVMGNRAGPLAQFITGQSYQFSADILAVSSDGRAFRRVRIVVDASDETAAPRVLFRRDLTDRGWPLDPAILTSMREGNRSRQTF